MFTTNAADSGVVADKEGIKRKGSGER